MAGPVGFREPRYDHVRIAYRLHFVDVVTVDRLVKCTAKSQQDKIKDLLRGDFVQSDRKMKRSTGWCRLGEYFNRLHQLYAYIDSQTDLNMVQIFNVIISIRLLRFPFKEICNVNQMNYI